MEHLAKYDSKYLHTFYEHDTSFILFITLCTIYTVLGSIIGGIFEIFSQKVDKKYGTIMSLIFQIIINVMFLALMRFYIFPLFVVQLQTITYGLLFTATFFGIQFSLYNNSFKLMKRIIGDL
jgi:flagellar biosynthesis protein FlhB